MTSAELENLARLGKLKRKPPMVQAVSARSSLTRFATERLRRRPSSGLSFGFLRESWANRTWPVPSPGDTPGREGRDAAGGG